MWFWRKNGLNAIADTGSVKAATKRINGGDIGLVDRERRYAIAMQALTGDIPPRAPVTSTLRIGSTGDAVKQMQRKLDIAADGVFGNGTAQAVRAWQAANGLVADGVMGPKSLAIMFG